MENNMKDIKGVKTKNLASRVLGGVWGFIKKHKALSIIIAVALVIVIALFASSSKLRTDSQKNAGTQTYIRTTILQKTSLDDTISATGSVKSADVSNVTTTLNLTVKTIEVQVGDIVKKGDVILTLDTSELQKQIDKAKEDLADSTDKANSAYSSACTAYDAAVSSRSTAKTALDAVTKNYTDAKAVYDLAVSLIAAEQKAYDAAVTAEAAAATAYNNAYTAYLSARAACADPTTHIESDSTSFANEPQDGCKLAYDNMASAKTAFETATNNKQTASDNLNSIKSSVGFSAKEPAYSASKTVYDARYSAYTAACDAVDERYNAKNTAYTAYTKSKTSDTLEELYDKLEKCTLVAETSGKVTAVNATVGNIVTGNAATIQDTDNLVVAISVAEYDISKVKVGMPCVIKTDATDGEIAGELSMISPVANASTGMGAGTSTSSTFDAEVTVLGGSNGLLVGMNAKVEIIVSSVANVFTVPSDAVETDETGKSIIYEKTGGTNFEPVFTPVSVTVGKSNDYYVEISGDSLREGMEIRSSAVEEEATVTVDNGFGSFGGNVSFGGEMPSGGGGNMPPNMGGSR